jgi:hypothetical protein
MTTPPHPRQDRRTIEVGSWSFQTLAFSRTGLLVILSGGIILGVWHYQFAMRALWVFRNNEPLSSWVILFAGPISTLPATLLAVFRRRWGAVWLLGGALMSLGGVVADQLVKGSSLAEVATAAVYFSIPISIPMSLLGLGLLWVQPSLGQVESPAALSGRRDYMLMWSLMLGIYVVLSVVIFLVPDWPVFLQPFETRWGSLVMAPCLGPLAVLFMSRLLGVPLYLAETAVVFGLLWIAATSQAWCRTALLGALAAWVLSGFFGL